LLPRTPVAGHEYVVDMEASILPMPEIVGWSGLRSLFLGKKAVIGTDQVAVAK
jgi:hypothetical protein